ARSHSARGGTTAGGATADDASGVGPITALAYALILGVPELSRLDQQETQQCVALLLTRTGHWRPPLLYRDASARPYQPGALSWFSSCGPRSLGVDLRR